MDGLAHFVESSGLYRSIARAEYPSMWCCMMRSLQEFYKELRYPKGKTRKGFSKWLHRNYYYREIHICKTHGKSQHWQLRKDCEKRYQ